MNAPRLVDGMWFTECCRCGVTLPSTMRYGDLVVVDDQRWLDGALVCIDVPACLERLESGS